MPGQALRCNSEVDVVLVLDGTHSASSTGFVKEKEFATTLVGALQAKSKAKVAIIQVSGPKTIPAFEKCDGGTGDMNTDCNVKLISPLKDAASATIAGMAWTGGSSYFSSALAMAENA